MQASARRVSFIRQGTHQALRSHAQAVPGRCRSRPWECFLVPPRRKLFLGVCQTEPLPWPACPAVGAHPQQLVLARLFCGCLPSRSGSVATKRPWRRERSRARRASARCAACWRRGQRLATPCEGEPLLPHCVLSCLRGRTEAQRKGQEASSRSSWKPCACNHYTQAGVVPGPGWRAQAVLPHSLIASSTFLSSPTCVASVLPGRVRA